MDERRFDQLTRVIARRATRRQVAGALVALLGGVGLGRSRAAQNTPAASDDAARPAIEYIALGDSVASGHGLMDEDGDRCEADGIGCCHRSARAYPHLVAEGLRERGYAVNFPDDHHLACSGATSAQLGGQVEAAIGILNARPAGWPVIVTITIGANDFEWTDPVNWVLKVLRLESLLGGSAGYFEWINETVDGIMVNLGDALTKLLDEPNVSVVVTEYPNPVNRESIYFTAKSHVITASSFFCGAAATYPAAQGVCNALVGSASVLASCVDLMGSLSCYERTDRAVVALNGGIVAEASRHAGGGKVRRARVFDAFAGRESPRPSCGNAEPDATASYIQYIGQANVNSTVPLENAMKLALGIPINATGDCFHPDDAGARVIADAVLREIDQLQSLAIVAGPDAVDVTSASAAIIWSTNLPASSLVEYGQTTGFGRSRPIEETAPTVEHRVELDNLTPSTTYFFQAMSRASGGEARSEVLTFATTSGIVMGCGELELCGSICVDVHSDSTHCGACGAACQPGESCVSGQCSDCPPGETKCGGVCMDLSRNWNSCGECGRRCGLFAECCGGKCGCPRSMAMFPGACMGFEVICP